MTRHIRGKSVQAGGFGLFFFVFRMFGAVMSIRQPFAPPPPIFSVMARAFGQRRRLAPVLLFLALAVLSTAAQAQTERSLVSNVGQSNDGTLFLGARDYAQRFTTGSDSAGYTVSSVDVFLAVGAISDTTGLSVDIRNDSNGSPGTVIGTLTNPTFTANVDQTFRFPAPGMGISLSANTRYHITFRITDGSSPSGSGPARTSSRNEDAGAAAGWSIADQYRHSLRNNPGWSINTNFSAMIRINTTAADTTAPVLSTAAVNGTSLVLTYDEALDTASTPAASAFTVTVAGVARTVSSVSVAGSAVTLTLSSAVTSGQTVVLSYALPTSNPIQDAAGNDAAALTNRAVTNITGDTTAPVLSTAAVNGAALVLTYDEALDTSSTPAAAAFAVTVASLARTVSSVSVSGSAVTLTLSGTVRSGHTVTVSYTVPTSNPIQDAAGNDAAALTNHAVTNNSAPVLSTATVNGRSLTLRYDSSLDSSSRPAAAAFTVTVAGAARTVSRLSVSGTSVNLLLSSAVTSGQTVTLSYAVPATNPVQGLGGNRVAALTNQAVTNNTPDTTAPVLSTAAVNGSALTLTYNEALDTSSTPAASAFTVTVAGASRTVSSVSVAGSAVILTLSSAVTHGQTVTLNYTVPNTNPIQDAAGNDAAALSSQSVTNSTADTTAPVLSTAVVSGTSLVLTYNEALDMSSTPAAAAFAVTVAGASRTVSSVSVAGSAVTLTLSSAVTSGQTVTLAYAVPTSNPIQDAAGNEAAALSNQSVTNNTPDTTAPVLSTAAVNGTSLVLTYNEALDETSTPAASAFTVTVSGSAVPLTLASVVISGSAVTLTLSSAVTSGRAVTLSYAVPTSNPIQDSAGNDAAAITNEAVTNRTAPVLNSATVNGSSLVLTYYAALDGTSTPAARAFTVTVAGVARTVSRVSVSGSTVTLTLSSAVTPGQTVVLSYTPITNPIRDTGGNIAAAFSGEAVTNSTPDTTAPVLSTAAVNGSALTLTYNEALDGTSTPAASAFAVTVAGAARTVSSVSVSGSAVTLTLASAVTSGQTVTLVYTVPTSNPIQDAAGNDAAALTNQAVTNSTGDTTAPVLSTAAVNGSALTLTYNEALDGTSTPAAGAFTVTVAGAARTVSSVAISGSAVTLTLASAVTSGQTVTLAYAVPNTNPIQDAAGNDAAALTNQAVTNSTPETTPPVLSTATVNGSALVLTYDEPLDTASTPAAGDFTVTVAGTARTVSSVAVAGSAVTLTLSSAVTAGQTVVLAYAVPNTNRIQDVAGNDAAALTSQSVTNITGDTTAPVLSTATVNGTSLTLTYNEALNTTAPAASAFTVTGASTTVSSVSVEGSVVTLTLSSAVTSGQTVTLAYAVPNTNPIQDLAGNDAVAFSSQSVTNNTPDTTAPVLSTATVDGVTLVLTYDEPLDTTSTPATGAFDVRVGGSVVTRALSGVSVSGSSVTVTLSGTVRSGQTVTVSYTVPNANPIQDTAGNDAAALTNHGVTNNTAPNLNLATVNGTFLSLVYNGTLDTTSRPAASAFTVTVAGAARTVGSVLVSSNDVTLILSSRVTSGQAVTVSYAVPSTNPIRDTGGNTAAALTNQAVTNETPPVLSSAAVNGATLVLTYDGALDTSSVPAASAFTVTVATVARTVSAVAISGSAVTLTLSSAVTSGQAVTVSYAPSGTNRIRDPGGNTAIAVNDQTVTNNTAPVLSSAAVNGAGLTLFYDGALDTSSVPAASAFTVTVAGSARTVSSVVISGSAVALILSSAVTHGQTVTVSYAVPATNPIQDAAGNDAASLSGQAVTNSTPDTTAPVFSTAAVNGATLTLTYNETLDTASTPAVGAFTVMVAGSARTVSAVAISGSAVTVTLSPAVTSGQVVTVSYAVPTSNPIQDAAGNDAALLSSQSVTNSTAPVLSSAAVNGATLVLTYDGALNSSSRPAVGAFTVMVAGAARTVSSVSVSGSAVTLTLSSAVTSGQTVTVSYAVPTSNPIQDTGGNDAALLSNQSVTNNTIPVFSTALVNGTAMLLVYDGALDTSSVPAASAFTVRVATVARTVSSVAISGSSVSLTLSSAVTSGQTVTVSYAVPATNPIRDVGGNNAAALTNQAVPNSTSPALSVALVDGGSLVLFYDGALDSSSRPAASAFTVMVAGTARTVSAVAISNTAITLILSSAVTSGQTVTVSYAVPTTNRIQDLGGNTAAAFTNEAVTNNTAPALSTATVDGTALVLTYDGALAPSR